MILTSAPVPVYEPVDDARQGKSQRKYIARPDLNINNSKHDKHLSVSGIFTIARETGNDPAPYLKKKKKMTEPSVPLSDEVSRMVVISRYLM
jgi:hypothetical protein